MARKNVKFREEPPALPFRYPRDEQFPLPARGNRALRSILRNNERQPVPAYLRANQEGREVPRDYSADNGVPNYENDQFANFINESQLEINGEPARYEDLAFITPRDVVSLNGQNFSYADILHNRWPLPQRAEQPGRAALDNLSAVNSDIPAYVPDQATFRRLSEESNQPLLVNYRGQPEAGSVERNQLNELTQSLNQPIVVPQRRRREIPLLRTAAPGAPRGPEDNGRNPGRPGRPGRPGGGPEDPGRPTGGPVVPEEREDKDVRHTRASATPPGNQLANNNPGVKINSQGLQPGSTITSNGQNIPINTQYNANGTPKAEPRRVPQESPVGSSRYDQFSSFAQNDAQRAELRDMEQQWDQRNVILDGRRVSFRDFLNNANPQSRGTIDGQPFNVQDTINGVERQMAGLRQQNQPQNPQQNGFLPPQLVNPVRPDNYQLPAVQQQAQVATPQQYLRPAGMQPNHRLADIRNNDRNTDVSTSLMGGGTGVAVFSAIAPLATNPATAGIAALIAGAAGTAMGIPAMIKKGEQWSNNKKMDYSERRILELQGMNQNDPNVQRELQQERQNLSRYAQTMHELAPQSPQVMEYINHLTGGLNASSIGQPGQQGQMITGPNGEQIPQGSSWGGRPEMIHRVGLLTPEQQALQNRDIQELMQNRSSFEPIAQQEVRRLKEETLPYVAEQYFGRNPNSFGGAYPEALGRAASSLGERLAAARSNYEANREDRLYRNAMNPAFDPLHLQKNEGIGEQIGKKFLGSATEYVGENIGDWAKSGAKWLNKRFGDDSTTQTGTQQKQQSTNYMPEPLSTINYNRKPSVQNIAQGAPDIQRALMEATENKKYSLGGRTR